MTRHRTSRSPMPHQPATAGDGTKPPDDNDSRRSPGTETPDYVVVVAASDWVKEHFPAAGANLWDALHTGQDRHRDPEPDLEAEP